MPKKLERCVRKVKKQEGVEIPLKVAKEVAITEAYWDRVENCPVSTSALIAALKAAGESGPVGKTLPDNVDWRTVDFGTPIQVVIKDKTYPGSFLSVAGEGQLEVEIVGVAGAREVDIKDVKPHNAKPSQLGEFEVDDLSGEVEDSEEDTPTPLDDGYAESVDPGEVDWETVPKGSVVYATTVDGDTVEGRFGKITQQGRVSLSLEGKRGRKSFPKDMVVLSHESPATLSEELVEA
jgi:hypothetical protein